MKFRCTSRLSSQRAARIWRDIERVLAGLTFCVLSGTLFSPLSALADDNDAAQPEYQPGQGYKVPGTDLTVGGYLTGEYAEHQAPTVTASNASLLFWWENESRLKLFSEIDFEEGISREGSFQSSSGSYLSLERFYADYALTDSVTVRLGKFLTPIGRWNQIHADPLVWTTSRPLVTELPFPTNATGLMVLDSTEIAGKTVDTMVYAASGDLDSTPNIDPFQRALGARVNVTLSEAWQIGASLANFTQRNETSQSKTLAGIDFLYQSHGYEVSSEALYRTSDGTTQGGDRGLYVQFVAPTPVPRLFAVYRYELFHSAQLLPGPNQQFATTVSAMDFDNEAMPPPPRPYPSSSYEPPPAVRLNIIGLTYRYRPNLVMKVEFVSGHNEPIHAPLGVLASISILF